MKRTIIALLVALTLLCLCAGALAQEECASYLDYGRAVAGLQAAQEKSLGGDAVASRLLMRSKKPMTNLDSFGPTAVVAGPQNHYTLQFSSVEAALACMDALKADKNVIYVQQDSLVSAYETNEKSVTEKADPYLSWGAKAMGADDLAASVTASGSITVAVVDSGVKNHPFLNDRVKAGGVDFTDPSYPDGRHDVNGHGTHVAGTIVDLTQGLKVNILPVRVLGDNGSGNNSNVCNGIRYAADAGAKVINMSLGGALFSPYDYASEEADALAYAIGKGVTVVVAAGNDATDTNAFQPACFDSVIVVAAIDSKLDAASFSNYGDSVDVCAPGVNITSCSINGGYTDFNGTSMASPHVAAIAAMVKLQNPGFSPARVENYIKAHCLDLGKEGWDRVFGCGMPCFVVSDAETEGDYAYKITPDGALITAYTGSETNVALPATLGGLKVIGVEEGAFRANATMQALLVPGEIKELGNFAFAECPLLKTVWFNEGVTRLGDSVFAGCTALQSVKLPDSLKNIGGEAFKGCAALEALELPAEIEAMGAYALSESGIKSITVPASLECVPSRLFTDCKDLEAVVIEEGVKRIDALAFDGCTKLQTLALPKSATIVGQAAFRGAGLESIDMPGVKDLGYGAFLNCEQLISVEVPEGVPYIDGFTFTGCPALQKVTLPRSVEEIDETAFDQSENVTIYGYTGSAAEEMAKEAKIPFESIGYQVQMTALAPRSEETLAAEPDQFIYYGDLYTYEPAEATMTDLDWKSSDPSVCDFVMHPYDGDAYLALATYAQGACTVTGTAKDGSGLSVRINVVVGDLPVRNVRLDHNELSLKIGETAALTATVLPEGADQSVVWMEEDPLVATVDEHGAVTAHGVGVTTIYACSGTDETLSDTCVVTVTAADAPAGTFAIRALDSATCAVTGYAGAELAIDIPATVDGYRVTQIAEKAFYQSAIASVTIPEGVTAIGAKAFAECKRLKSAALPNSLTSLADDAFKGCKALPNVKKIELRLTKAETGFVLTPVFTPTHTASAYTVSFSGKKSATADGSGLVTPLTDNYFTVTVKAGGKKAVLGVLTGEPYAAAKVTINGKAKRTVKLGKTLALSFAVKPASARVIATWTSANPEIATVDQDGVVTPVARGKVKITLTTDVGLKDAVTVTVK